MHFQTDLENNKKVKTSTPPVHSRYLNYFTMYSGSLVAFFLLKFLCLKTVFNIYRLTSEFEILNYLGGGSYGCVYMVNDKLLGKDFAMKIVDGTQ